MDIVFNSFWYVPKVELLSHVVGNSMSNIFGNCLVFQSSCTILQHHKECMRILIPPHPCHHLLFSVFHFSHPGVHEMVLIYFFLMSYDIEYFYILLTICILCQVKIFSYLLPIKKFGFVFYCWVERVLRIF